MNEITCIACPIGCRLTILDKGDNEYEILGNQCPKGEQYAIKEMTNPTRMITTTVRIKGAHLPRLPVKTSEPIPKEVIFDLMKSVNDIEITAPVEVGTVVVKDILGLGIDVVATRRM